jgi:hypothetical protein
MSANQPFQVVYPNYAAGSRSSATPLPDVGVVGHATLTNGLLAVGGGNVGIGSESNANSSNLPSAISTLTLGNISSIELREVDGVIYKYEIYVVGKAASNAPFTTYNLGFTDQTNDTYYLQIWLPVMESHYVSFNSGAPNIVSISIAGAVMAGWSDTAAPESK